jgi:hypothetical protein
MGRYDVCIQWKHGKVRCLQKSIIIPTPTQCDFLCHRTLKQLDYHPDLLQKAGPRAGPCRHADAGSPVSAGHKEDWQTHSKTTFKVRGVLPRCKHLPIWDGRFAWLRGHHVLSVNPCTVTCMQNNDYPAIQERHLASWVAESIWTSCISLAAVQHLGAASSSCGLHRHMGLTCF